MGQGAHLTISQQRLTHGAGCTSPVGERARGQRVAPRDDGLARGPKALPSACCATFAAQVQHRLEGQLQDVRRQAKEVRVCMRVCVHARVCMLAYKRCVCMCVRVWACVYVATSMCAHICAIHSHLHQRPVSLAAPPKTTLWLSTVLAVQCATPPASRRALCCACATHRSQQRQQPQEQQLSAVRHAVYLCVCACVWTARLGACQVQQTTVHLVVCAYVHLLAGPASVGQQIACMPEAGCRGAESAGG